MDKEKIEALREHCQALRGLLKNVSWEDLYDLYMDEQDYAFWYTLMAVKDCLSRVALMSGDDSVLFYRLAKALQRAESLHPVFAEGVYQGLGRVSEELGELAQSVNHRESQDRIEAEALDLLVTAWRFCRKDYEPRPDCEERPQEGVWQWTMARNMKRV